MKKLEIIGLMSGTSLDGLDLVHVEFSFDSKSNDSFKVLASETVEYQDELKEKLMDAPSSSLSSLLSLDKELGRFFGKSINQFLKDKKIDSSKLTAISSHGHTILHQPSNGFTLQIGCGDTISFVTGIQTINDFRTKDIVAGGQGAPLVPIGDFGLFQKHAESFLNIGGFSNFSFKKEGTIYAYDICPGNLPLNKLAKSKGLPYDKNGELAKSGEINFFLLDILNKLPFYGTKGPKSLGTEWLEEKFYPLLKFDKEIENNLRTVVEHEALQISNVLNDAQVKSVLVTGGGAKNEFLVSRIKHYFKGEVIIPDSETIDYKEAIIFAYLGALNLENRTNNVPSVTGASKDLVCGVVHRGNS